MPPNFNLLPLPLVIVSTLLTMIQRLPEATQQREVHQRSRIALGFTSKKSSSKSISNTILSSIPSPTNTNTKSPSSSPSPKPCAKQNFFQPVSLPWLQAQSVVPWTMWVWSSGTTSVVIPDSRKTGILLEFYKHNTEVIKTRIQIKSNKKQSISVSSNKSTEKEKGTSQFIAGTIFFTTRVLANILKYQQVNNAEQKHLLFIIFASSSMETTFLTII